MSEIICPHCHKAFKADESAYASILLQVRNKEFQEELSRQIAQYESQQKSNEEALRLKIESDFKKQIAEKNDEISALKTEQARLAGEVSAFDTRLKAELTSLEAKKDRNLSDVVAQKEKDIAELKVKISEKEKEIDLKVLEAQQEGMGQLHEKEVKIKELELSVQKEKESASSRELDLKERYDTLLKNKDDEIERLREYRLRLSTKMLGETLEQHCKTEFERAKSYGQFPHATFEKDNMVVEGTKGDFIFRDFVDGQQCVSIMFEMKNEADTTATKHKNEHFFEKLHKDREKKDCEFAILVSMLEQDNDLYNEGIVDVSYRYQKMLVIRPQFFLPVLRLISEGARKGFIQNRELVAELESVRNESRDFSNFEDKVNKFATNFSKYVNGAQAKINTAAEGIDKVIANLEKQIASLKKAKDALKESEKKWVQTDDYVAEHLTVKKLTHGAPSVKKMIEEAAKNKELE